MDRRARLRDQMDSISRGLREVRGSGRVTFLRRLQKYGADLAKLNRKIEAIRNGKS
jgi:hypothetical protein